MAEYWKSTPKYWCKFCEVYVRDTQLERRNHEASGKHQGGIQRSLREVHKGKQQQEREQQRAKSEVARLNNLVGSRATGTTSHSAQPQAPRADRPRYSAPAAGKAGDAGAQRRATAEQWSAMGITLPEELQEEVTGTGAWQTVAERVVGAELPASEAGLTMPVLVKGVHKRKAGDEGGDEDVQPRMNKAWGSRIKSYGDTSGDNAADNEGSLAALLSGVSKGKAASGPSPVESESRIDEVKNEAPPTADSPAEVKVEESESVVTAPPIVTFKKRKAKR